MTQIRFTIDTGIASAFKVRCESEMVRIIISITLLTERSMEVQYAT